MTMTPYNLGRQAFHFDEGRDSNPYRVDPQARAAWFAGYDRAKREAMAL